MAVVPRIGTEFAGYRIEALLGRGGMSVVYRAENARLGNKVALKLIAEELADDEGFRERFVRESRTAAALNHPNVVPIYDAGDEDGVLFIAMRYVESDLKQLLSREGPLSVAKALAVVGQIGSALDAAHARGLLHRDVKPANTLLDAASEPGGAPHAYLADFGLTKHLESRSGITASGQFVGTIDYMSPEQIEGRDVDGRTDIYSLGCVLFECLAGATPFRRETEVAVLWAHMRDEPPPVTERRPELPGAVDLVIARAVAKDPANRYATARELVDELRASLEGVPDAATRAEAAAPAHETRVAPAAPAETGKTPVGVLRWALLAAAILVSVGLGAVGYALLGDDPEVIAAEGTQLSPEDVVLLNRIPGAFRGHCRPTSPLTPDFDARMLCPIGTRAASRVEYNHGKSGNRMRAYFLQRAIGRGLAFEGVPVRPTGRCGPDSQALRDWKAAGETGHTDRLRRGDSANGRVMCFRQNGWAGIEWTDARRDIYSTAYGSDLRRLYGWWREAAGPTA